MTQFECRCGGHSFTKRLRQFSKYCWPNLNNGKIYIFVSNTFSMIKFTFGKKWKNALRKNSLKELDIPFARW